MGRTTWPAFQHWQSDFQAHNVTTKHTAFQLLFISMTVMNKMEVTRVTVHAQEPLLSEQRGRLCWCNYPTAHPLSTALKQPPSIIELEFIEFLREISAHLFLFLSF